MAEPARKLDPEDKPDLKALEGGGETSAPTGKLSIAKPDNNTYDKNDSSPITGPELVGLEGGGEESGRRRGNLRSVSDDSDSDTTGHENQIGSGYKSSEGSGGIASTAARIGKLSGVAGSAVYVKLLGSKKKKAGAGGIVGLIVTLFLLSIISGPSQFIQLAQLMQQFHFKASETQTDFRATRLMRYATSGGNISETRVGSLGSKLGNKIEANFKAAGFIPEKVGLKGYYGGITIDQNHPEFKGKSPQQIKLELEAEGYKLEITPDGKVRIPIAKGWLSYGQNVRTIENLMKRTGYSGVSSAVQARTVAGRWFGFGRWHPLRQADARINESLPEYWKKITDQFRKDVENGSVEVTGLKAKEQIPPDPCINKSPPCTAAEQQAYKDQVAAIEARNAIIDKYNESLNEVKTQIDSTAGESTKRSKYTRILGGSLSDTLKGSATGAIKGVFSPTVVLCLLYGMDKLYEEVKVSAIVLPLIRESMQFITIGNQVMNGNDVNTEELGAYNQLMSDTSTGSWLNAPSIQAQLASNRHEPLSEDEKDQQSDLSHIGKPSPFNGIITEINKWIPGTIGDISNICSTAGQIVLGVVSVVIGILSGGSFSIAAVLVQGVLGGVVQAAVESGAMHLFASILAGTAVDTYAKGAMLGTNIDYGSRLASNGNNVSRGGKELTPQESAQAQKLTYQYEQQTFASHGLAYRLFNPYDPRSTFARLLANQPHSLSEGFAKMSASIFNVGSMFSKLPSLMSATAGAQSFGSWDYGFPEYGFSVGELDNDAVENPYDNADAAVALISSRPDLVTKAHDCFGVSFAKDSEGKWGVQHVSKDQAPNPYNMDKDKGYAKLGCNTDTSTEWLRLRFFIFDTTTMDALACYEGNATDDFTSEACNNVGMTSSATASTGGGAIDCNNAGDPSTWGDLSAGNLANYGDAPKYKSFIEQYAPGRDCPGSMFPTFQTPANAIPNDPNKQYFASCSDNCVLRPATSQSDPAFAGCGGGTWYGPGGYIRVKYRNPPSTSNTICIPTFTPSSTTNPPATGTGVCTQFPNGWRWIGGPKAGQPCP